MSDFQPDQNHSELLQSEFNLTNRQNLDKNENHLNYADTFSSYHSNEKKSDENEQFDTEQFIVSDNNFSLNEKEEKKSEDNCVESEEMDENGEEIHMVNFKITILASFPIEKDSEKDSFSNDINKPRATEGPKPIRFYKFEYQLLPDDPDTLYSADLVTFKSAIKIYPDKFDPKVVRVWENENKMWATWSIR